MSRIGAGEGDAAPAWLRDRLNGPRGAHLETVPSLWTTPWNLLGNRQDRDECILLDRGMDREWTVRLYDSSDFCRSLREICAKEGKIPARARKLGLFRVLGEGPDFLGGFSHAVGIGL